MPTPAHLRTAAKIRVVATQRRFSGPAAELVKLFGVPFTADGVRTVQEALSSQGLGTKTPLTADKPRQRMIVVIVDDAPREPLSEDGSKAAAGWYHDPDAPDTDRYWDGAAWADEWAASGEEQAPVPKTVDAPTGERRRLWPGIVLTALGAAGYWFAQTYKPTISNQLGLNGNTFYLRSGPDHTVLLASIIVLAIGIARLLMWLVSV